MIEKFIHNILIELRTDSGDLVPFTCVGRKFLHPCVKNVWTSNFVSFSLGVCQTTDYIGCLNYSMSFRGKTNSSQPKARLRINNLSKTKLKQQQQQTTSIRIRIQNFEIISCGRNETIKRGRTVGFWASLWTLFPICHQNLWLQFLFLLETIQYEPNRRLVLSQSNESYARRVFERKAMTA